MKKNKVLIITNKEDITVDCVIDKLNNKNIDYYRFNTEEIGNSIDISIDVLKNNYYLYDKKKDIKVNLKKIYSIYFRRPKLPIPPDNLSNGEKKYFLNELYFLLEGIYRYLYDKKWLNNVYDIRNTENKIFQLNVANKIGFLIPSSLITNISLKAKEFIDCSNECIFKPIKSGYIEEMKNSTSKILYTTKVDKHFYNNIKRIIKMPIYLQKEISKKADIRVTIVNNNLFAAEIDSQSNEVSKIDWRRTDFILPHKSVAICDEVKNKCLKLCEYFKLKFAAIDLVLDKNNVLWFLEINPNGQWAWLEKLLDYPISDEIVKYLLS